MTIINENLRNDYIGNGVAVTYAYTFPIFNQSEMEVIVTDTSGVPVTKTLTTDYSVTGVGEATGGNVVFVTPPTNLHLVALKPTIALTQTTDLVNETGFFQDRIEGRFDKLCRADQIAAEKLSRSLKMPEGEAGSDLLTVLPALADRKGRNLSFDPTTAQPTATSPASAAVSAAMQPVVASATLALARAQLGTSCVEISPKDSAYGAVGDGTANDTTPIQNAVNALPANGGVIKLPAGTYKITATIVTNGKNVWFRGEGKYATIIRQDTVGAAIHGLAHSGATQFLLVSDLSITTPADLTADNGQCAIRADIGANGSAVDNSEIHVWNCQLSGFNFGCYVAGKNAIASAKFSIASVRNCHIRHRGATSASVSEAVNHHHVRLSIIEDNTLDVISGNGDHSIYCYTPRHCIHRRNAISNAGAEAVKLLTNAAAGEMAPYAWLVDENTFMGCLAACYMTIDGAYTLPLASFSRNAVITGGGGGTSAYEVIFQTLSSARIKNAVVTACSFQDCQKGIVLFSAGGTGIIESATIDAIHAFNWSASSAGTYSAISDSGPGTCRTLSVQGYFDGNSNGRAACNASVFAQITYRTSRQINCTAPNHMGNSVELGTTGANVNAMAVRHVDAAANVGTPASLVETTLKTLTIAANTLAKTGQGIRVRAWGTTAANANNKVIRLKYGGTTLLTNGVTTAPNGQFWEFEAMVFRTGAALIAYVGKGMVGAIPQNPNASLSAAIDNTVDQSLVLTGQNGVATASDIVFYGMAVEYLA